MGRGEDSDAALLIAPRSEAGASLSGLSAELLVSEFRERGDSLALAELLSSGAGGKRSVARALVEWAKDQADPAIRSLTDSSPAESVAFEDALAEWASALSGAERQEIADWGLSGAELWREIASRAVSPALVWEAWQGGAGVLSLSWIAGDLGAAAESGERPLARASWELLTSEDPDPLARRVRQGWLMRVVKPPALTSSVSAIRDVVWILGTEADRADDSQSRLAQMMIQKELRAAVDEELPGLIRERAEAETYRAHAGEIYREINELALRELTRGLVELLEEYPEPEGFLLDRCHKPISRRVEAAEALQARARVERLMGSTRSIPSAAGTRYVKSGRSPSWWERWSRPRSHSGRISLTAPMSWISPGSGPRSG